jgi:hypothetical protein
MPQGVDEKVWNKAKSLVEQQYGSAKDKYALVMHLYQKMMGAKKAHSFSDIISLVKGGGPYIGPRGGKWADAKHTIPWKAGGAKKSIFSRLMDAIKKKKRFFSETALSAVNKMVDLDKLKELRDALKSSMKEEPKAKKEPEEKKEKKEAKKKKPAAPKKKGGVSAKQLLAAIEKRIAKLEGKKPEKKKRPSFEQQVKQISSYAEFKSLYQKTLLTMFSYTPGEAGSAVFAEKMGHLEDAFPDFAKKYDEEQEKKGALKPDVSDAGGKQETIRRPEFLSWFGDWTKGKGSKVVNEAGEPEEQFGHKPVKMFHGTAVGGFTSFDPDKDKGGNIFGKGFYFTADREIAESYTKKDEESAASLATHLEDARGKKVESLSAEQVQKVFDANFRQMKVRGKNGYELISPTNLSVDLNAYGTPGYSGGAPRLMSHEAIKGQILVAMADSVDASGTVKMDRFFEALETQPHLPPKGERTGIEDTAGESTPDVNRARALRTFGEPLSLGYGGGPPAEVFEVYLSVKNPIDMDKEASREAFSSLARFELDKLLARSKSRFSKLEADIKTQKKDLEEIKNAPIKDQTSQYRSYPHPATQEIIREEAKPGHRWGSQGGGRLEQIPQSEVAAFNEKKHLRSVEYHAERVEQSIEYLGYEKARLEKYKKELASDNPTYEAYFKTFVVGYDEDVTAIGGVKGEGSYGTSYDDLLALKKHFRKSKYDEDLTHWNGQEVKAGDPVHEMFHLSDADTLTWGDIHYLITDRHQSSSTQSSFTEWAKREGHDGIHHTGGWNIGSKEHSVWIAFESEQIKSVDSENFDPKSVDIYKSRNPKMASTFSNILSLVKGGGPYIGPRGGKWADAKHTIPWKPEKKKRKKRSKFPFRDAQTSLFPPSLAEGKVYENIDLTVRRTEVWKDPHRPRDPNIADQKAIARRDYNPLHPSSGDDTALEDVQDITKRVFGRALTVQEVCALAGLPSNATAKVRVDYIEREGSKPEFRIRVSGRLSVEGERYGGKSVGQWQRTITKDKIENDLMTVEKAFQKRGIGAQSLYDEASAANALGIPKIECYAAGPSREYQGYYVWPLLGYSSGEISSEVASSYVRNKPSADRSDSKSYLQEMQDDLQALMSEHGATATPPYKVSDLMTFKAGRKWWKENGIGGTMTFDTTTDSPSMQVIEGFVSKRKHKNRIKKFQLSKAHNQSNAPVGVEQAPMLDAEDMAVLEALWDKQGATMSKARSFSNIISLLKSNIDTGSNRS